MVATIYTHEKFLKNFDATKDYHLAYKGGTFYFTSASTREMKTYNYDNVGVITKAMTEEAIELKKQKYLEKIGV